MAPAGNAATASNLSTLSVGVGDLNVSRWDDRTYTVLTLSHCHNVNPRAYAQGDGFADLYVGNRKFQENEVVSPPHSGHHNIALPRTPPLTSTWGNHVHRHSCCLEMARAASRPPTPTTAPSPDSKPKTRRACWLGT